MPGVIEKQTLRDLSSAFVAMMRKMGAICLSYKATACEDANKEKKLIQ